MIRIGIWHSRFGHFAGLVLLGFSNAHAKVVEYDLQVAEARWSPESGMKASRALTLNGGIPGPTLRFREGDTARIRVKNLLKRE
jgi:FtsP/CotA-like multicopper oxidase with cupredoxin domain